MNRSIKCYVTLLFSLALFSCTTDNEPSNPYVRGDGSWGSLPGELKWGATSAIHYAGDNKIWVAYRCGGNRGKDSCDDRTEIDPILLFDTEGRFLNSFGAGLFVWPHGIYVDHENNVWVTDAAVSSSSRKGNQVHKFSPDGELLMSLGIAGVQGNGHYFFNAPNDVLVAPNGDIFIADGHSTRTNNRIVKFNANGEYLLEWGSVGGDDGQFRVPHALAMDSAERLFVADRGNNRLQIFDQGGNHLHTWTQFGRPSDLYIDGNDTLYSADSESNTGPDRNPGWQRGIYILAASKLAAKRKVRSRHLFPIQKLNPLAPLATPKESLLMRLVIYTAPKWRKKMSGNGSDKSNPGSSGLFT